jgi:hypothetical protein
LSKARLTDLGSPWAGIQPGAPENEPPEAAHGENQIARAYDGYGQKRLPDQGEIGAAIESTAWENATKCGVGLIVCIM